jgi:hypothetical protein
MGNENGDSNKNKVQSTTTVLPIQMMENKKMNEQMSNKIIIK